MKKLTTEQFIERARKVHGDKYDYSKVEYKASGELVTIVCPIHGEFKKSPENHLHKTHPQGCPFCEKENPRYNQLTTEQFIERARKAHGDKYDYSKTNLNNRDEEGKVIITCPIHGDFRQNPNSHLKGRGCRECGKIRMANSNSNTLEKFIEKARKVHGDRYDYSKVEYINNRTEVVIICPKHGEFKQTPDNHLMGRGCKECKREKLSKLKLTNWDELLIKMNKVHNGKYDYDKSSYIDTHHDIKIICPIHGEFPQTPHAHLRGQGCPECGGSKKLTVEQFVERAKKVHGDKYDYSSVIYNNYYREVIIKCPTHGEFKQKPIIHLNGCGCQRCNESHLETEIDLKLNNFEHKNQYKFDWLGRQSLDFYLPQYNIAIECQGKQHFGLGGWTKNGNFEKIKELDTRKKQLCEEHGIKLYYFSHEKFDKFLGEKVYHDADELIEEIKKS